MFYMYKQLKNILDCSAYGKEEYRIMWCELEKNRQYCEENVIRNSIFLHSYLIIRYIRESGNGLLGLDLVIFIRYGSSFVIEVDFTWN